MQTSNICWPTKIAPMYSQIGHILSPNKKRFQMGLKIFIVGQQNHVL